MTGMCRQEAVILELMVFAAPGTPASMSCRIYRDETGRGAGAPSVEALRRALRRGAAPLAGSGDA
jgi:hypothetical protein